MVCGVLVAECRISQTDHEIDQSREGDFDVTSRSLKVKDLFYKIIFIVQRLKLLLFQWAEEITS